MKNYLKKMKKPAFLTLSVLLFALIFTVLEYTLLISEKTGNLVLTAIVLVSLFLFGVKIGKGKEEKGYLEGLKLGGIIVGCFLICSFILGKNPFCFTTLLYYLLIVLSTTLGAMLGINKK